MPGEGVDQSALEAYEECLSGVKSELLDETCSILALDSDNTELTTREENLKDYIFRVSLRILQLHNSIPVVPTIVPREDVKVTPGELPKIEIPAFD